ncbi:MAG: diapophytoene dehydrogenase [Bacteroidetes bacterium]|nr:MAG: diapophytoene dehydrogenase [Bacteroidota bacterium]
MAQTDVILPKMGESVAEATITKWLKAVGDTVEADESLVEIATDKVDSEIPSPVGGVIAKILAQEGETVLVGAVIAIIAEAGEAVSEPVATVAEEATPELVNETETREEPAPTTPERQAPEPVYASSTAASPQPATAVSAQPRYHKGRFYSPLVRKIASNEGVPIEELEKISGNGKNGRVTKNDILAYLSNKNGSTVTPTQPVTQTTEGAKVIQPVAQTAPAAAVTQPAPTPQSVSGTDEIISMDRMRKLIADHMVKSVQTSAHVTSFAEADVSSIVNWRNNIKKEFEEREGEKITFTPIFIEAVSRAVRDFPMVNVSVDGHNIIIKKDINIGMAAALPSGNLIVPVIRNADRMNLYGLTKAVNDLANRARNNKLVPDEIQGGTFTMTNVGTFGNIMGTPIINQPQVAILATGAIQKKPVVIETEEGDTIGIRHMMFLSLSYDHRVVDGALGGTFLKRVADYLESFDANRVI